MSHRRGVGHRWQRCDGLQHGLTEMGRAFPDSSGRELKFSGWGPCGSLSVSYKMGKLAKWSNAP